MIVTIEVEGVEGLADRLARSLAPRLAARAQAAARNRSTAGGGPPDPAHTVTGPARDARGGQS